MNTVQRLAVAAAASATLGVAALGATSASAQGWRDDGYGNSGQNPSWQAGARDYNSPWGAGYGYNGYDGPGADYDTGITDYAVCPPGYHLGHAPGVCWPNR